MPKEKEAWRPPEDITVSEWADKYRIMDTKTSAFPGQWKGSRTPYLTEVMNSFNDLDIEEVVFVCSAQVGKTETLNNVLGYIVDQDPNPALVVYPTLELAEFSSENRIQPMMDLSQTLKNKFDKRASNRLELQFPGMYICLAGANSPASLASRPIRYVLMDEVDKFPLYTGKEGDPVSLARERTKTFWNKKIMLTSTPTVEHGAIWQAWNDCDVQKEFFVPCPHCGTYQPFEFKQIKWPEEIATEPSKVRDCAWYACAHCEMTIDDSHKPGMLRLGKWQAINQAEGRVRKIGFRLNCISSPWVTFGDVAAEFIRSKEFPERLRNFVNSWLGEPWRDKRIQSRADELVKRQGTNERGEIPAGVEMLTAGVDVQLDHLWWEVRGYGEYLSSVLIDYGRAETWDELEEIIIHRVYRGDASMQVRLAAIDSGYRTDEVYEFCSRWPDVCKPIKGASAPMRTPYTISNIDKDGMGLKLWVLNTPYYKDLVWGRMEKEPGERGAWVLFKDCPVEYCDHLTAEARVLVRDRKTGQISEEWQRIGHSPNHLFDTCIYATAAAEICGVRYLGNQSTKEIQSPPSSPNGFIPKVRWFKR